MRHIADVEVVDGEQDGGGDPSVDPSRRAEAFLLFGLRLIT